MKSLIFLPVLLMSYSFVEISKTTDDNSVYNCRSKFRFEKRVTLLKDDCITATLENIAGDTYAIKFYNKCDTGYKVYYQVIDNGSVIQDTSTCYVKAKSGNSSGTIHCSALATIIIIKKEFY